MKTEERILAVAGDLLEKLGPEGLTTRAVQEAAGISPPTLYHHFGDKEGLIRALITNGVAEFLGRKDSNAVTADPEADLKRGWDLWLDFAAERPTLFRLMASQAASHPEALKKSYQLMRATLQRLDNAGRLTADLDTACQLVWAASNGVLTSFMQGTQLADLRRTSDLLFKAVTRQVLLP